MQSVSESYNPNTDERWSNIRVVFELIDVDAAEDAIPTATSEAEISNLSQTHNRILTMSKKIASGEPNSFILDGTFLLPDEEELGEVGWWSNEISDADGNLITPQVLEFVFTAPHSSVGFMVIFDELADEYASDFKIQAYDSDDNLIEEDVVTGNTLSRYASNMPVDGYHKMRITFSKTSKPRRRIRVSEVVFGIIQTFTRDNSTMLNILYEISPTMENLPSNEMSITIENVDRKYNMINPHGIYRYLQLGQGLDVEIGVGKSRDNHEYVNMGRFYFASATAEDSALTAQITAYDQIYALDRGLYRKGVNATDTVEAIVNDIITDSGMVLNISMTSTLASRVIGRNIPIVSHREALRMVAQAARAICFIDRNDTLIFTELAITEPVDVLDNNNLYTPAKVEVSEYINTVEVVGYTLIADSEDGETVIYQATIPIAGTKEIWITYDGAQITSPSITGGTIDSADYYLYACRLTITAAANVTLTLNGYNIEMQETLYRAQNLEGNPEYSKSFANTLVRNNTAQSFAEWLLAIEQGRVKYVLQERGNPAREICDTVTIYDAYGENQNSIIIKQEYQFDGTLSANSIAWEGI